MGEVLDIADWRARRTAREDIPIGAPPFVLVEPCPGCGARRVTTMVWRRKSSDGQRVPFPRIEPHFLCSDGHVVWQELSDATIPVSDWSSIFGRFETAQGE